MSRRSLAFGLALLGGITLALLRLDVVRGLPTQDAGTPQAAADTAPDARVDSGALGLLRRDTTRGLTFDRFGARLLAVAAREHGPDSNTVASPVSAGMALSLALLGARGTTAADLSRALGTTTLDRAALERRGAALTASAVGREDVQFELNHAVWVDSAFKLTRGFEASAAAWGATVGTLRLASREALVPINGWADRVTHGRIPAILDEPLARRAALFLASSVYFKGKWLEPFEKAATRPRDFTLHSGQRVAVPMMERTGMMAYRREAGYQMVRLPYRGDRVALYVILPDSGAVADALPRRFATHGWPASLGAEHMVDVHLVLPKLHAELTLDLRPLLAALGAGVAVDCERADFGDLVVERAARQQVPLCVSRAVQRVYLDLDEEGTEAAAITGVVTEPTSAPSPLIPFLVDRPFLFVLRDESSGADLFVGRIQRP